MLTHFSAYFIQPHSCVRSRLDVLKGRCWSDSRKALRCILWTGQSHEFGWGILFSTRQHHLHFRKFSRSTMWPSIRTVWILGRYKIFCKNGLWNERVTHFISVSRACHDLVVFRTGLEIIYMKLSPQGSNFRMIVGYQGITHRYRVRRPKQIWDSKLEVYCG